MVLMTTTAEQPNDQPMLPFEMGDIPLTPEDQAKRGWELAVNGELVAEVATASLSHPKMGLEVTYGTRPEGYDGFIIREPGGAATIPYMIDDDGGIFVGVVKEYRPTMGEAETLNIPRGFSDITDKSKRETAERELKEETGATLGSAAVLLAEGLNPNSTFFDYSKSRDAGVSIYAKREDVRDLVLDHDEAGNVFYSFPAHVQAQAEGDKTAERILGSRFIPISEALQSRDMFTSAAAGQLTGYLLSQGEYLLPQKPANTQV
jgi:8-oxo-dGTP pyrophosphatase MutT (NUDIX family)